MQFSKLHSGIFIILLGCLILMSSCAMSTACGMTKKQSKAKHKMYSWK